ncbi:MAG: carboxy-S-adenosyl-L-methionine synthase CmoA [Gammaproteobacteria bacterium]|nr:carboxy-S-adenosyl-L-methionine synthase CmoA [Gammaproteobacteria bacterium]
MNQDSKHDQIYAQPLAAVADFRFDESVAKVFPDMINRSVPGYSTLVNLIGVLAVRYVQPGSRIYDLGCSLGASTLSMLHHLQGVECQFVAVDNSAAMIERARVLLPSNSAGTDVSLICADIQDVSIEDASVVVMNYTLQFLSLDERLAILQSIYQGLRPGGILILSEKIRLPEPEQDERFIELHHQFKKANGYSDLEISQKRSALERVLIPETIDTHSQRLLQAGFARVDTWYQCLNFVSLLAQKS